MESKFEQLYTDYKASVEENKELRKKLEAKEVLIKQSEKAKENYKDQAIDLKQEIKQLKQQLREVKIKRFILQNSENID